MLDPRRHASLGRSCLHGVHTKASLISDTVSIWAQATSSTSSCHREATPRVTDQRNNDTGGHGSSSGPTRRAQPQL